MKKIVLLVVVVLTTVSMMAEISDNFKKAGIGLGGSISYNSTSFNSLSENEEDKRSSTSFYITPGVEIMAIDNLSISINPGYSYSNLKSYDENGDVYSESSNYGLSLSIGATYYLVGNEPVVPFLGASYNLRYDSGLIFIYEGEELPNKWSIIYNNFYINGGALYFLNDNLALRGRFSIGFLNNTHLTDEYGDEVVYADDYDSLEDMNISTNLWFGISYYFPNSNSLIVAEL